MFSIPDIFQRQQDLFLFIPQTVTIIGLGGVGSWLALDLALLGVRTLTLVDNDLLEPHNLNRTPYTQAQARFKQPKVLAITTLIRERRHGITTVIPYGTTIQQCQGMIDWPQQEYVFDCTDTMATKETIFDLVVPGRYLKLGYDGPSLQFDATRVMPWGDPLGGYRTVPSFLCPPQFLACVATAAVAFGLDFSAHPVSYDHLQNLIAPILGVSPNIRFELETIEELDEIEVSLVEDEKGLGYEYPIYEPDTVVYVIN